MVKRITLFFLLSFTLLGCAFFGVEDFPSYLPYVREIIDSNKLLSNKNITNYTLVAGKFINLGNKQYIAAHVASKQNPGEILGIIITEQNNPSNSMWISKEVFTVNDGTISRYLFPTVNYLASGDREFNPFSASITYNSPYTGSSYDQKSLSILFPNGNLNYFFRIFLDPSSNIVIDFNKYNDSFTLIQPYFWQYSTSPFQLQGYTEVYKYFDILRWSENVIAVLVGNTTLGKGEVALFQIDLTMYDNPSYSHSIGSGFPLFNIDHAYSSLWLTHDGVVGFDRRNRQLIFYEINNLSQEKSTLTVSQNFIPLGFSEDGDSWLAFDETKGKIFRLRSWW